MSVVLVVEPDSAHAEILRKALRRVSAELLMVSTAQAAIKAIDRSVPDLILISALLSPRNEDALFAHLRLLEGASHVQLLTIPQLRKGKESAKKGGSLGGFRKKAPAGGPAPCDPSVFADQVRTYLTQAREVQSRVSEMAETRSIHPPVVVSRHPANESSVPIDEPVSAEQPFHFEHAIEVEQLIAAQPTNVVDETTRTEPPVEVLQTLDDSALTWLKAEPTTVVEQTTRIEQPVDILQTLADSALTWLKDESPETARAELTPRVEGPPRVSDDPWIDLDVNALAQLPEPERLENPLTVEEVESQFTAEIQRLELYAQERREAELVRVQAEAQARMTAEVERVQAEAEQRRQHELARVLAEAEEQRHTAVNEARAAAESEARSALIAEMEQVRLNELARVQAEADQRVDVAARQAREAADAARAMTEELARIRTQVEQTLNSQLEHARAEAEQLREAEQARAQADAAARRDAAARDARFAVEAAASRALEAEVARVRADAEARLRDELDVIRQENEHLRRVDQSDAKQTAEKVRAAAVRDARAIADAANQTLEAELVRVRAEADERLEAELAKARAQAERQRATELEEIRAQVAGMRETASQQARRAAADAIASEVARGALEPARRPIETTPIAMESRPAAPSASDYYSLWKPQAAPVAELPPDGDAEDTPRTVVAFVRSKWKLPVAAALVVVVGNGLTDGLSWRPRFSKTAPSAVVVRVERPAVHVTEKVTVKTGELQIETTPGGARVLLDGTAAGKTPLTLSKLKPGGHTLVLQSSTGTLTRKVVVRAGETTRVTEVIFSGWLAVFAAIPLNIHVDGHLRGTTDDGQVMMMPGTYDVELVSERFNYRETKRFTIEPGKVASYTVSLPTGVVHINCPDGTDISIDGKPAGRAPLGYLSVTIGTHEVVATSAELGARRQSVEVSLGQPTEVTLR